MDSLSYFSSHASHDDDDDDDDDVEMKFFFAGDWRVGSIAFSLLPRYVTARITLFIDTLVRHLVQHGRIESEIPAPL